MEFTRLLRAETREQIAIHLGQQQMVIYAHGRKDWGQKLQLSNWSKEFFLQIRLGHVETCADVPIDVKVDTLRLMGSALAFMKEWVVQ